MTEQTVLVDIPQLIFYVLGIACDNPYPTLLLNLKKIDGYGKSMEKVSEDDQKIPQPHTADQLMLQ